MPSAVTVLAHVEVSDQLTGLVESLDAQSLPYADFDVIFLVSEAATDVRARLEQLAQWRPNVALTTYAGDWPPALFEAAVAAAGEWIVPLGPQLQGPEAVLLPHGLERLVAFGREHECDLVVGRVCAAAPELPIPAVLRQDLGRAEASDVSALLESPAKAYRTEWVRTHQILPSADDAERSARLTDRLGVLAGYPVMRGATIAVGAPGPLTGKVSLESASWRSGALVLEVRITEAAAASVSLSVRHLTTAEEYWLPTAEAQSGVSSGVLDVRTAAAGAPLLEGQWHCYANAYGTDGEAIARSPLPPADLPGAVLDGLFVATATTDRLLTLDVGGTRVSPLPALSVDQVQITEDAAGTLLTAQLPSLHVVGTLEQPAALRLGAFRLPGYFRCDGETARLECFVSGLASTNVLSHQLGFGPIKRTSLDLVIDEVGGITVVPTRERRAPAAEAKPAAKKPAAKKAAAKKPAAKKAAAKKAAPSQAGKKRSASPKTNPRAERSLLTRIRRNVPPALEPIVERLADNPQARKAYQKLTGRA